MLSFARPSTFQVPTGFREHRMTLTVNTVAVNALGLALPILSLQIYDRIIPSPQSSSLKVLALATAFVILAEMGLRLARAHLISLNGAVFTHRMTLEAMDRIVASDLSRRPSAGVAGDYHSLSAIRSLKERFSGQWATAKVDLVFVPVFLALIAYIGGWIVFVPLALLAFFGLWSFTIGVNLQRTLVRREDSDDQRYEFLISTLDAIHELKAFGLEKLMLRRYENLQEQSCAANFEVAEGVNGAVHNGQMFAQLVTVATVAVGAMMAMGGSLTVGGLVAVIQLSSRLMQPLQQGLMLWARRQDLDMAEDRVQEILSAPAVATKVSTPPVERAGQLAISDLDFAYPGQPEILRGLELKVSCGEAVAISSPAGAGKGTLLKLVAGLAPTGGEIRIDGALTTEYAPADLAARVGYLTTEGATFRGTIRENICRFGEVPMRQALEVAELIGLDRDVAPLPLGLDTRLEGLESDSIPPGLKQRIAIVRALAAKPRVILYHNADRALDAQGYSRLFRLLGRLRPHAAMLIVSDDANLRALADRQLVLTEGRLEQAPDMATADRIARPYRELRL